MNKLLFLLILMAFMSLSCKKMPVTVPVIATCLVKNSENQPISGKTLRLISGFNLEFKDIATGKIEQTTVSDSEGKAVFNYTWTSADPKSPTYYVVTDDDAVYKVVHNMIIDVPYNSEGFTSIRKSGFILMDKMRSINVRIKKQTSNVQLYTFSFGNLIGHEATVPRSFFPRTIFTPATRQVDTVIKTQIFSKNTCCYLATMIYTDNNTSGQINDCIDSTYLDSTIIIAF